MNDKEWSKLAILMSDLASLKKPSNEPEDSYEGDAYYDGYDMGEYFGKVEVLSRLREIFPDL